MTLQNSRANLDLNQIYIHDSNLTGLENREYNSVPRYRSKNASPSIKERYDKLLYKNKVKEMDT